MKELVQSSGLTQAELAKLMRVARPTVSLWLNGKAFPGELTEVKWNTLLDAIKAAVDTQDLPLPNTLTPQEREAEINRRLTPHILRAKERSTTG